MNHTIENNLIWSINLYRIDRYNFPIFFVIIGVIGVFSVLLSLLYLLFSDGEPLLIFMLLPILPLPLIIIFYVFLPGRHHFINIYYDKLQEESTLFKTFTKNYTIRHDIPYKYLRIYPGRAFFIFKAYTFKDIRLPGERNIAPDLSLQIMSYIRQVVSENQWQEIYQRP